MQVFVKYIFLKFRKVFVKYIFLKFRKFALQNLIIHSNLFARATLDHFFITTLEIEISKIRPLTHRRPLRRKLRMWFFDVSKVKESRFFKSDLTDPQIFIAHLLENTDLSPSRFHFSVGFISRSYLESDNFIAYLNE